MGRPRKTRLHLPDRVYLNHGKYYYVDKENKWIPLGKELGQAMQRWSEIVEQSPEAEEDPAVKCNPKTKTIKEQNIKDRLIRISNESPLLPKNQLPKRVYFNHGAYYYVDKNSKWWPLGKTPKEMNFSLNKLGVQDNNLPQNMILHLYKQAKTRANRKGIEFNLSAGDMNALFDKAKYRCEITGIIFSNKKPSGHRIRPWVPSLDRKDSKKGYTVENTRLVCAAVNLAMNEFGDDVFDYMATNYCLHHKKFHKALPGV